MCYTSSISLTTAIIEWILAIIMIKTFKRTMLRDYFTVLLLLLGAYQFSEFMLCGSDHALFWAKFGFFAYSFLPAIFLDASCKLLKKSINPLWIYLVPTLTSIYALGSGGFVSESYCSTFFVRVTTLLKTDHTIFVRSLKYLYATYYGGAILISGIMMWRAHRNAREYYLNRLYLATMIGIILMTVPTYTLLFVFPEFDVMFPSILCHFALGFGIMAFIAAYLESRVNKRAKR